jgi:hypothetical protein
MSGSCAAGPRDEQKVEQRDQHANFHDDEEFKP